MKLRIAKKILKDADVIQELSWEGVRGWYTTAQIKRAQKLVDRKNERIMHRSFAVGHLIDSNQLKEAFRQWSSLRQDLRKRLVSKNYWEHSPYLAAYYDGWREKHYLDEDEIEERRILGRTHIPYEEDHFGEMSSDLYYYSDRWGCSWRVGRLDFAFKKAGFDLMPLEDSKA